MRHQVQQAGLKLPGDIKWWDSLDNDEQGAVLEEIKGDRDITTMTKEPSSRK